MVIKQGVNELFCATLIGTSGTLYQIVTIPSEVAFAAQSSGSSGNLHLWHRRLGHIGVDSIREMVRRDMVKGLMVTSLTEFDRVCEGCMLGKSHRLPFLKASEMTYEKGEVIVMDLSGPMSVETWTGMHYAFIAVEVSCRKGFGHLLKKKKEAPKHVKDTVALVKHHSGHKVHVIRTDSGSEFLNKVVTEFCECNGILHETTNPYTPEQNSIVEHVIAIYFEMVRCMLHSVSMDLHYWGEAFMYTLYICNVTYTSALKD
jgi:hypothetical protein